MLATGPRANLIDAFTEAGQADGVRYGIPVVSSAGAFFCNKSVFARAGITAAPTTWDEVKQDAELIRAKVSGVTPYALPLGPEEARARA